MMLRSRSAFRHLAGLVLVAVMLVGAVCHFGHHLIDPDCGASPSHASQPCATCAGLHGSATAIDSDIPIGPVVIQVADVAQHDSPLATSRYDFAGTPRAPPIA